MFQTRAQTGQGLVSWTRRPNQEDLLFAIAVSRFQLCWCDEKTNR